MATGTSTATLERAGRFIKWRLLEARRWPGRALNHLFGTAWYDRVLSSKRRIHPGHVAAGDRYAVYLIFPKHGLQPSHLKVLQDLIARDHAPVVVSNLPLSAADRTALVALAHAVIERPNYGYDFGGYRDGVLFLASSLPAAEQLVLLNDSVWTLPGPHGHWLDQVQRTRGSIVGAVANYCVRFDAGAPRTSAPWTYDHDNDGFHYCSFALAFRRDALSDPAFLRFWKKLKLTNDKLTTIQRGEIGLGQWIRHSGHTHCATFDLSGLDRALDRLDTDRIRAIAERLIVPQDPVLRARIARLLNDPELGQQRQALIALVLEVTAATGAAYALPDYATKEGAYPFLKKSPLWLDPGCAAITLSLIEEQHDEELLAEAQRLRH